MWSLFEQVVARDFIHVERRTGDRIRWCCSQHCLRSTSSDRVAATEDCGSTFVDGGSLSRPIVPEYSEESTGPATRR
jgi:hypothetical protein